MSEKWFKVMHDGRITEVTVTHETKDFICIEGQSGKIKKTVDGYYWYRKTLDEGFTEAAQYHKQNVDNAATSLHYAKQKMQDFLDKRFLIMSCAGLDME